MEARRSDGRPRSEYKGPNFVTCSFYDDRAHALSFLARFRQVTIEQVLADALEAYACSVLTRDEYRSFFLSSLCPKGGELWETHLIRFCETRIWVILRFWPMLVGLRSSLAGRAVLWLG